MTLLTVKPSAWNLVGKSDIFRRCISINYLLSALKVTENSSNESKGKLHVENICSKKFPPKDITKLIITPNKLNDAFRHAYYERPSKKQIHESQRLFNNSKVHVEWTFNKYSDIPDVKSDSQKDFKMNDIKRINSFTNYQESTYNLRKNLENKKGTFLKLPEILLLGRTNVGKSSLINSLLVNKEELSSGKYTEHAFVSRRAGFTKTLNCFNVGNKFRIIDSPGYGEFGEQSQGEVVLEYISKRKTLRKVFVLIDSIGGFSDEDVQIINHLVNEGVPFEFIFTKVDEVISKFTSTKLLKSFENNKDNLTIRIENADAMEKCNQSIISYYETMIDNLKLRDLITLPQFLFNNSKSNKLVKNRYGYKEIRFSMLQSCGLVSHDSVINSGLIPESEQLQSRNNNSRRKTTIRHILSQ